MKLSLSLKVTHLCFRHALPYLWNQLPTSLRNSHPNYSSPSQRLSFEHAALTLLHANFLTHANVLIDWPIPVSLILCCVYAYILIYWLNACLFCRHSAWCSSKRSTVLNRRKKWNSESSTWSTASLTRSSSIRLAVFSNATSSSSQHRWLSSSV